MMNDRTNDGQRRADEAAASGRFADAARHLEAIVAGGEAKAEIWTKLSAMRRVNGDLGGALEAIDRSLAIEPLDFAALLARAFLLERVEPLRAGEAFAQALAQQPPVDQLPPALATAAAHGRGRAANYQVEVEQRLLASIPAGMSGTERARIDRFLANVARRSKAWHQEPTHFVYPGLPEIEFHDLEDFSGVAALGDLVNVIRAEFEALLAAESAEVVPYIQYPDRVPLRQWKALNRNRDWSALHLIRNGQPVERNARHCPRTMAAVASFDQPVVPGASPNLMFSLLAPRTHIPPHHGVANTRLVAHLPLIVPPNCRFRCGGETREWKVGTPFIFDDTIEHEAWNDSDELRVVMIFDLWPPALTPVARDAVARIISNSGISANDRL